MSFPQDTTAARPAEPTANQRISLSRDAAEAILREIRSLKAQLTRSSGSKRLLSKREAAKYLGVSRGRTLDVLIAVGRLRTVRIGGRLKIPFEEVDRFASATKPSAASTVDTESAKILEDFAKRFNRSLKQRGF